MKLLLKKKKGKNMNLNNVPTLNKNEPPMYDEKVFVGVRRTSQPVCYSLKCNPTDEFGLSGVVRDTKKDDCPVCGDAMVWEVV
jgi:hypothetical protein